MVGDDRPDDLSVADDVQLWRRVPPWHFEPTDAPTRPSSAAFDNDPDGEPMSVVLGDEVLAVGRSPVSVLRHHPGFALTALTAGQVRDDGNGVVRDPLPDEPAHALVVGVKSRGARRRWAKSARWVVEPGVGGSARSDAEMPG